MVRLLVMLYCDPFSLILLLTGTNTTATTQTTTATTTALVLANYNITFKMLTLFTSDLANLSSIAGSALKQAVSGQVIHWTLNIFAYYYQSSKTLLC